MRITFLFGIYAPVSDGVGNCTRSMAQALAQKGYHVDVITCHIDPKSLVHEVINGVHVHRILPWEYCGSRVLGIASFFLFGWLRLFLQLLRIKPNIFFGMMLYYGFIARVLQPFFGYKTVTLAQGSDVDEVITLLQKITVNGAISGCDIVCATNSEFREKMQKRVQRKEITLLQNCIAEQDVHLETYDYGFSKDKFHAISVGRMVKINGVETKGMSYAVKAVSKNPRWILHLFGDGPYRKDLELLVEELDVSSQVIFHGNVVHSKLCAALSQGDVLLFPSMTEGLSKTVIEACYLGVPIITTPIGGQKDYLKQDESVLFVEPGNPQSINNALSRLESEPELFKTLAHGACSTFEQFFTYDAFVERFEQIIQGS